MTDQTLLFYSCADKLYEDFAGLYIASSLWSVPEAFVEVGLVSYQDYATRNPYLIAALDKHFKGRYLLRDVPWSGIIPNTVRFVNEPKTRAQYVYIGDIDILHLDKAFPAKHLAFMERTGLPYANTFRKDTDRLTGLHFTGWDALYPLPDISDVDLNMVNDEVVLGIIAERKGAERYYGGFRPVPGIHVSPNRKPVAENAPDWGLNGWTEAYEAFRTSDIFKDIEPYLIGKARASVDTINTAFSLTSDS